MFQLTNHGPVADTAWPPKSPHAALLSSPSGRRKYHGSQDRRQRSLSPLKGLPSHPDLERAARKLFVDDGCEEQNTMEAVEEDEETLQLKLAAIEAKLKLKKLQHRRENNGAKGLGDDSHYPGKIQSSSNDSTARPSRSNTNIRNRTEVPVSPTKRGPPQSEQRSPGRVLLGIDKGMRGTDVSLRRARSMRSAIRSKGDISTSSEMKCTDKRSYPKPDPEHSLGRSHDRPIKSFSERMAENRVREQKDAKRREAIASKRSSGFKLNHAEMENFQKAAAEARLHQSRRSPPKDPSCTSFSREDILRSRDGHLSGPGSGTQRSTTPKSSATGAISSSTTEFSQDTSLDTPEARLPGYKGDGSKGEAGRKGDSSLYDPFSQLHLSSRILPHSFLQRTFPAESHTCVRLPQLLKQVKAPAYELPGLEAKDIVIVGVVGSKSNPLDHKPAPSSAHSTRENSRGDWERKWEDGSQNEKKFMVLQISDLIWSVDLYLFGTALPKYHRIVPGTVVAILNPGIMPPRKGKEDTGAFSLTVHHGEDTILEVGSARDLGFCSAIKRDGQQCGSWVNLSKTEVCEWHLNAQITKTQAGRMGVNTGSNGMGRGMAAGRPRNRVTANDRNGEVSNGKVRRQDSGPRFDWESQSHYYMAPTNETQKKMNVVGKGEFFERSATALMDLDDDDPFIAAGRLSRDTETRMKKRLLTQEKEREIALKLGSLGSGGAGGEYLRHHTLPAPSSRDRGSGSNDQSERSKSALATKDAILRSGLNVNGKRAADSVRLSPMKKTRFVTKKGVREAGRESLGGKRVDHDSDLDIV